MSWTLCTIRDKRYSAEVEYYNILTCLASPLLRASRRAGTGDNWEWILPFIALCLGEDQQYSRSKWPTLPANITGGVERGALQKEGAKAWDTPHAIPSPLEKSPIVDRISSDTRIYRSHRVYRPPSARWAPYSRRLAGSLRGTPLRNRIAHDLLRRQAQALNHTTACSHLITKVGPSHPPVGKRRLGDRPC